MNLVLSDFRFLTTTPGFSAADLLRRIDSPRLQDLPPLWAWIDSAADAGGISRELLCCIAQKEQSAFTLPSLSAHALADFCGYDGGDGVPQPGSEGPEQQLRHAARGLRYLFNQAALASQSPWIAVVGLPFRGICTPSNRATAALYSYTPSIEDKQNLLAIWREFNFGDPLADNPPSPPGRGDGGEGPMTGFASLHPHTVKRLQAVGISDGQIVQGVATTNSEPGHPSAGTHDSVGVYQGRRFGHCIDVRTSFAFTRAHFDALVKQGFAPFAREGWPDGDHWHLIDASGLPSDSGRPDHLPVVNNQLKEWVRGGDGLVGTEPMPDRWRPSPSQSAFIAKVWISHTDFTLAGDLMVVDPAGNAIDCHPAVTNGVTRADLREVAEALGYEAHYRVQPQGPRIYLKPFG